MATITGYTAARMKEIEDKSIIDGGVVLDDLILTRYDGTTINAGNVRGPQGPVDPNGVNLNQSQTITGFKTFSTPPSATALAISGLSGAALASRYVGATAGGKPTSGTFAVGDYIIDHAGYIWICTVAGTPGTWISPARGTLPGGYAQRLSNTSEIGNTETTLTDLTVSPVIGTNRRIRVTFQGLIFISGADMQVFTRIKQDGIRITMYGITQHSGWFATVNISAIVTPAAGARSYSVTSICSASTHRYEGNTDLPIFLNVEDIGGV